MKQSFFNINEKIQAAADKAMETVAEKFNELEEISEYNQQKVLAAFLTALQAPSILKYFQNTVIQKA